MEIKNKGRTLACGDIHGNYKALMQCLQQSNFDYKNDTLIQLGDVVDGHCESFEVVEELLKIKNLIFIKGNHDDWFDQWIKSGINPANWKQGQKATGLSYLKHSRPDKPWMEWKVDEFDQPYFTESVKTSDIPDKHIKFFDKQLSYYRDDKNNLFIHGGFNRHFYLNEQLPYTFWWDRDLWYAALSYGNLSAMESLDKPKFKMIEDFKEVFIGHTTTECWKTTEPMNAVNIWNLDTGAGMYGKLTIMDVNTKEYWQSDTGKELYPEYTGRN
jgi:serine/threonine protein phosphatase 1